MIIKPKLFTFNLTFENDVDTYTFVLVSDQIPSLNNIISVPLMNENSVGNSSRCASSRSSTKAKFKTPPNRSSRRTRFNLHNFNGRILIVVGVKTIDGIYAVDVDVSLKFPRLKFFALDR